MSKASVNKGKTFERELAKFFEDHLDIPVRRSILATQMFSGYRGNSDLVGLPGLAVEAKRVESLNVRSALMQAQRNANRDEVAIVVNRRNRETIEDALVAMSLADFISIYRKSLLFEGRIREPKT